MTLPRLLLALAFTLTVVPAAGAQTVTPMPAPTIITSAPYTISKPGFYQLGADLVYTGTTANAIITLNSGNVTLDFGGHYISGPANNSATPLYGVYATERGNIVIQNGTITYCEVGIYLVGNGTDSTLNINQRVQNMLISHCYYIGVDFYRAQNSSVTNCTISFTGGSPNGADAFAIDSFGGGNNRANNNTIVTVNAANGTAYGIYCNEGCFASNNTISNLVGLSGDHSTGIYFPIIAADNLINTTENGIVGGTYKNNTSAGVPVPYSGGTDAGGNF